MTDMELGEPSKCSKTGLFVVTAGTKIKGRPYASSTTAFGSPYPPWDFLGVSGVAIAKGGETGTNFA